MRTCTGCGAPVATSRCPACGAVLPRGGRYGRIAEGIRKRLAGDWDDLEFRRFVEAQLLDHRRWQASLKDLAVESGLWWMDPADLRRGWAALREVERALEMLLEAEGGGMLADALPRLGSSMAELQDAMQVKEPSAAGLSASQE